MPTQRWLGRACVTLLPCSRRLYSSLPLSCALLYLTVVCVPHRAPNAALNPTLARVGCPTTAASFLPYLLLFRLRPSLLFWLCCLYYWAVTGMCHFYPSTRCDLPRLAILSLCLLFRSFFYPANLGHCCLLLYVITVLTDICFLFSLDPSPPHQESIISSLRAIICVPCLLFSFKLQQAP